MIVEVKTAFLRKLTIINRHSIQFGKSVTTGRASLFKGGVSLTL